MNERELAERPEPSSPLIRGPDFRLLFESLPGLYLVLTPDFRIVAASDAYLRATMTRREEVLGQCVFDVFPDNPDDPTATGVRNLRASLARAVRQRGADTMPVQKYDVRRPESEGGGFEARYWSPVNSPVIEASGEVAYVIHRVEDVTESVLLRQQGVEREQFAQGLRSRNEQIEAEISLRRQEIAERRRVEAELREAVGALRRSEGRFQQVWGQSRDAVRLTDAEGTILLANPAYCDLVGKPRAAVEGLNFSDLYAGPERAQVLARHGERFARRSVEPLLTQEITLHDGRKVHLEFSNSFLEFPGEPPLLLSVIRDVTSRVALEERYRQAQKMEAVGRLAGGVAHDFNNLLTVINGYGELLLRQLPREGRARDMVAEMLGAGERAAMLTGQLLAFSRKQTLAPRVLDLDAVILELGKLLRRLIGEDVDLATAPTPGLWPVVADPSGIEQILVNLAVNARDAMPTGGKLTIETANVDLDESYARTQPGARSGPHVLVAVSDTGCGMDEPTRTRAFEPFFSTKGEKGTGLGLATVWGVAEQSGGHVAVYSEVGKGTAFKVYLPRAKQATTALEESGPPPSMLPTGSETVLLVEDDAAIRALGAHVLCDCGYRVLEAPHGDEALRLAGGHQGRIDLLVTDVVMPRMGGRDLAERLSALRPGLKVLFVSGYTDDAVIRHGVLGQEMAFLQKPFTTAGLAQKVREVLGG